MAVTKQNKVVSVRNYYEYLLNGKDGKGVEERVADIDVSNATLSHFVDEIYRNKHKFDKNDLVSAYTLVTSYSENELDCNNEDDVNKAMEVAKQQAIELFGEWRQTLIVAHIDSGKLHTHTLVGNVDTVTGKALRGSAKDHRHIAKVTDKIIKDMGILNENEGSDLKRKVAKKTKAEEQLRAKGKYVWKDDLKSILTEELSRNDVTNQEDFENNLLERGIKVSWRGKDKTSVTYQFETKENKTMKARATTLGVDDFGYQAIQGLFKRSKESLEQDKVIESERHETPAEAQNQQINDSHDYWFKQGFNQKDQDALDDFFNTLDLSQPYEKYTKTSPQVVEHDHEGVERKEKLLGGVRRKEKPLNTPNLHQQADEDKTTPVAKPKNTLDIINKPVETIREKPKNTLTTKPTRRVVRDLIIHNDDKDDYSLGF